MTDPDTLRAAVRAAGEHLAETNAARASAMAQVRRAVRASRGQIPVGELARLAGITPVAVRRLLDDE